jgi:hypothetical protein
MVRFDVEGTAIESTRQLARDTTTGLVVVLERHIRSDRLRQLQALPKSAAVAPFERVRDDHRLRIAHPAPLVLTNPVDEFDVAQAIGSMLDGLAWLHAHGVAHGAVDAMALTAGPTGGRLSLAGALSEHSSATPEDDVYAASALAFTLLVGSAPGPDAYADSRLTQCASRAVTEAIRAGLDRDATRRPGAAALAAMVRGERLLPILDVHPREAWWQRMRDGLVARPYVRRIASGVATAVALIVLAGGLVAWDDENPHMLAATGSPMTDWMKPSDDSIRVDATSGSASTSTSTTAPSSAVVSAPETTSAPVPVAVLAAPPQTQAPPTTAERAAPPPTTLPPPPPPVTTLAPQPVSTTSSSTTTITTTTRRSSTTRRPSTTTTQTTTRKGKGSKDSDDDSEADVLSVIGELLGL